MFEFGPILPDVVGSADLNWYFETWTKFEPVAPELPVGVVVRGQRWERRTEISESHVLDELFKLLRLEAESATFYEYGQVLEFSRVLRERVRTVKDFTYYCRRVESRLNFGSGSSLLLNLAVMESSLRY